MGGAENKSKEEMWPSVQWTRQEKRDGGRWMLAGRPSIYRSSSSPTQAALGKVWRGCELSWLGGTAGI